VNFTLRPDPIQQLVGKLGTSLGKGIATAVMGQGIQLR